MANCNNTIEFLREKERMCKSFEHKCSKCPIGRYTCDSFIKDNPKEAIILVQKWSDEHPVKTIMMDFLEKYPNAEKEIDGTPSICPYHLGYKCRYENCCCDEKYDCIDCWNMPLSEVSETK